MHSAVVLVLHDPGLIDDILNAWREAGAPAVTLLDSVGTRELEAQGRRDDLPLMPTIKDLLQGDEQPRKTMFAIVERDAVDSVVRATEEILGDLTDEHRGILFAFPLERVVGFRGP